MQYKGLTASDCQVGDTYTLGNASFTILAPVKEYADSNNASIVIMVQNGNNRFLFTGDCEAEAEADLIASGADLSADVYLAGHHGSDTASSQAFMDAVSPSYAVISCGEGNSYGHPHAEVLNRMYPVRSGIGWVLSSSGMVKMGMRVMEPGSHGTVHLPRPGRQENELKMHRPVQKMRKHSLQMRHPYRRQILQPCRISLQPSSRMR